MPRPFSIRTMLITGLAALPLLLTVGCADSGFAANNESALAQQDLAGPESNAGMESDGTATEYPLPDCSKAGSGKVYVCHVPAGNPDAKHTICVSEPGATHGHGLNLADVYAVGAHGGDRLGTCESLAPEAPTCPAEGC